MVIGDTVRVNRDEHIPADLLLLSSSGGTTAYVDTRNLDGETNLKVKDAFRATRALKVDQVLSFPGLCVYEI